MEKYFCGIDLGTSSLKMGIINKGAKIIWNISIDYPIFIAGLKSEQNPGDWWEATKKAFVKMPSHMKDKIISISFSGQMHGLVLIDKKGVPLRRAILWNDMRTFKETIFLNEKIGKKNISDWTGNIALEGFTATKILWVRKHEPNIFKNIFKILLPKDYLIYKFTSLFATEHSDASGTLYYDTKQKKWSNKMLEILNINIEKLPKIYKSTDVVYTINSLIAHELKINVKTLIVAGGADNAVAAVSLNILKQNQGSISLGTSGVIYTPIDKFQTAPNNELHTFVSATGNYYQMGVINSAANSIQWFIKNFTNKKNVFEIERKIDIYHKNTILFHPYISGERTPINDPKALGSFFGITRDTNQKDVIQGIMEGVGFAFKQVFDILVKLNIDINTFKITGGGSKSDIWCKMLSSILNIEILRPKNNCGAFFGAALLAMIGTKQMNFDDIEKIIGDQNDIFKPDIKLHKSLNIKYNIWKKIYPKTKTISYELHKWLEL